MRDYAIFLILLKKKNTKFTCEIINKYSLAPFFVSGGYPKLSKGIVGYYLKFGYDTPSNSPNDPHDKFKTELSIYTCHLPFEKDVTINKGFIEKLRKGLLSNKNDSFDNTIIFGDLNSRSLVTDKCYVKNSETCPLKKQKKNTVGYCEFAEIYNNLESSNQLERINDVKETVPKWNQSVVNLAQCGEGLVNEVKDITDEENPDQKVVKLVSLLKNRDFLCNPPNHDYGKNGFFDEMFESDIKFLPTYKRISGTGNLTTIDDKKVRLPGYADRIIYLNQEIQGTEKITRFEPNNDSYTSLFITGNDHLPVYQDFTLISQSSSSKSPSPSPLSDITKKLQKFVKSNRFKDLVEKSRMDKLSHFVDIVSELTLEQKEFLKKYDILRNKAEKLGINLDDLDAKDDNDEHDSKHHVILNELRELYGISASTQEIEGVGVRVGTNNFNDFGFGVDYIDSNENDEEFGFSNNMGGGKREKTKQRRRRKRNTKSRKKKRRSINNKKSRKRNYRRKSYRS